MQPPLGGGSQHGQVSLLLLFIVVVGFYQARVNSPAELVPPAARGYTLSQTAIYCYY